MVKSFCETTIYCVFSDICIDFTQNMQYNTFQTYVYNNIQKGVFNLANKKQTSKSVASTASKILRDNRYSDASKSVAGSALSQTKSSKKK